MRDSGTVSEPWRWRRDRDARCVAWVTDTADVWGRIIKSDGRFYWGVLAPGLLGSTRQLGCGDEATFDEACDAAEAERAALMRS